MEELTKRQKKVLSLITEAISRDGYPPSIREIGTNMGIRSTNGVYDHIKALEKKGYLSKNPRKSRALKPIYVEGNMLEIPVLGKIAAGKPILAVENIEDTVKIDRFFLGNNKEVFALRVVGESMIEAGISNGDFIFVRKQFIVEPGEIVVAMIDNEATVKRYFPEKDKIRFQPENSAMQPIYVNKSDFNMTSILGVVIGLYRKF